MIRIANRCHHSFAPSSAPDSAAFDAHTLSGNYYNGKHQKQGQCRPSFSPDLAALFSLTLPRALHSGTRSVLLCDTCRETTTWHGRQMRGRAAHTQLHVNETKTGRCALRGQSRFQHGVSAPVALCACVHVQRCSL